MKLLFCGDIVGRAGRDIVIEKLPGLKKDLKIDMAVINAENSAGGYGVTTQIANDLFEAGADVITTGNHVWKQKELFSHITSEPRILRPDNYSNPSLPGRGIIEHTLRDGRKFIVLHMLARVFMPDHVECPFQKAIRYTKSYPLASSQIAGIMLDFHGEATSEKMAMGQMLDGDVSFVVGTHTHIPTADHQILPKGTAYQTDAGMCGDYDSVIGMEKTVPVSKFCGLPPTNRMAPALGPATMCGTIVTIDDRTGLATAVHPLRVGGRLQETIPSV